MLKRSERMPLRSGVEDGALMDSGSVRRLTNRDIFNMGAEAMRQECVEALKRAFEGREDATHRSGLWTAIDVVLAVVAPENEDMCSNRDRFDLGTDAMRQKCVEALKRAHEGREDAVHRSGLWAAIDVVLSVVPPRMNDMI